MQKAQTRNVMFFGQLTSKEFVDQHWRRSPAKAAVSRTPFEKVAITDRAFLSAARKLRKLRPQDIGANRTTTFAQQLDHAYRPLETVRNQIAEMLGHTSLWIDGVRASAGGSIGAHFDHSDNFVVQQSGTKLWRLAPPDGLTAEELVLRMLGAPDVGGACMPDEYEEFELKSGEVLYIPLFWIHHGISVGRSLSLSVVCNMTPLAEAAHRSLSAAIAAQKPWTPLPIDGEDRGAIDAVMNIAVEQLQKDLKAGQVPRHLRRFIEAGSHQPSPTPRSTLQLDIERIKQFVESPVTQPDLSELVMPAAGASRQLRAMTARVFAKRFFVAVSNGWALLDEEDRLQIQTISQVVEASDAARLELFLVRPEVTSWILRAAEAATARHIGRFRDICSYATLLFLPLMLALKSLVTRNLVIRFSGPGLVHLLPYGVVVDLGPTQATSCHAEIDGATLLLSNGASTSTIDCRDGMQHASGAATVRSLSSAADGRLLVLDAHLWLSNYLPRGTASRASTSVPVTTEIVSALQQSVNDGVDLIRSYWPYALEDLFINVGMLSALASEGLDRHNETIPAFRGLVRTSARPSYLSAQMLVHESAHNRLNSIMDVFDLLEADLPLWSPFVRSERPATAVLHGAVSFINELELTSRLFSGAPLLRNNSMERYVNRGMANLKDALAALQQLRGWTAAGRTIVDRSTLHFEQLTARLYWRSSS